MPLQISKSPHVVKQIQKTYPYEGPQEVKLLPKLGSIEAAYALIANEIIGFVFVIVISFKRINKMNSGEHIALNNTVQETA